MREKKGRKEEERMKEERGTKKKEKRENSIEYFLLSSLNPVFFQLWIHL